MENFIVLLGLQKNCDEKDLLKAIDDVVKNENDARNGILPKGADILNKLNNQFDDELAMIENNELFDVNYDRQSMTIIFTSKLLFRAG